MSTQIAMLQSYARKILSARIYDVVRETPIDDAPLLSKRLDNRILMKREDRQPVFSFKIRGAYNKLKQLSAEQTQRGVITASAGNHAQGLAMAAHQAGIMAVIVMPVTTPAIKVNAVKAWQAKIVLHGDTFDQALAHTYELIERHGYSFVPPYDDPDVIAGQGTIGMEIIRQHTDPLDAVFVPVGGGGLIAGITAYLKYVQPDIRMIGVEYEDSACLQAAMKAQEPVTLEQVGLFADGAAVARIGDAPFRICKDYVDEVITVSADEICAAIKDIYDDTRAITEPAGALAIAGIKKYTERDNLHGQTLLAINSGANVNFDRLRHIAERADLGEGKEAVFAVTIDETCGSFQRFCQTLGKRAITEFNYRYHQSDQAQIFVGMQMQPDHESKECLIQQLQSQGYPVIDLTDNEMAKLHVRYMVGGRAPHIGQEKLFRFEFPERPGALLEFLRQLGQRWNISLFHYRNHGAAYGRVMVGWVVPETEHPALLQCLERIGYRYWDESDNPAYRAFLEDGNRATDAGASSHTHQ